MMSQSQILIMMTETSLIAVRNGFNDWLGITNDYCLILYEVSMRPPKPGFYQIHDTNQTAAHCANFFPSSSFHRMECNRRPFLESSLAICCAFLQHTLRPKSQCHFLSNFFVFFAGQSWRGGETHGSSSTLPWHLHYSCIYIRGAYSNSRNQGSYARRWTFNGLQCPFYATPLPSLAIFRPETKCSQKIRRALLLQCKTYARKRKST